MFLKFIAHVEHGGHDDMIRRLEMYEAILENSFDLVAYVDASTREYRYISPSYERVLGLKASDLLNRPVFGSLAHPDEIGNIEKLFYRAIAEKKTILRYNASLRRTDGAYVPMECVAVIRYSGAGPKDIVVISRDNTEHLELDKQRTLAVEAEKQAHEAKSVFFAKMTHELRTPLSVMIGLSEDLLADPRLNPESREKMAHMYANAQYQLLLVNNLLDVSKISAGEFELDVHDFSVSDMVKHMNAILVEHFAAMNGVAYRCECPDDIGHLRADRQRIEQVLINLLSNAVKFTQPGREIGLSVAASKDGSAVVFEVWDQGCGIEEEQQQELFKAFKQGKKIKGKKGISGTGLGLNITEQLVTKHGGTIEFRSIVRLGSSFKVTIPGRNDAAVSEVPVPDVPSAERVVSKVVRDKHILVVEDDTSTLFLMKDRFMRSGFTNITYAVSAEGARAEWNRRKFDLVITDLDLPDIEDGTAVLTELRSSSLNATTPVVANTADGSEGVSEKLKTMGYNGHLVKPYHISVMLDTIVELLKEDG